MKYKIGYLDTREQDRINFYSSFEDAFDVKIIDELDSIPMVSDLMLFVNELDLDALIVDYHLSCRGELRYNGNDVVDEFSKNKRCFPILILTSFLQDAISQTDNVFVVMDKKILDDNHKNDLFIWKAQIAQAITNYKNKVRTIEERIKELELKRIKEPLTNSEEEELIARLLELKSIDPDVHPLPDNLLQTGLVKQLSELVEITLGILKEG